MPLILLKFWKPLAGLLILIIIVSGIYLKGRSDGKESGEREVAALKADYAKRDQEQADQARAAERLDLKAREDLKAAHLKELEALEKRNAKVVADLKSGARRLRDTWTCPVSPVTPGGSGFDAKADLRAESAGRITGAVDECDLHVIRLQAELTQDRKTVNGL